MCAWYSSNYPQRLRGDLHAKLQHQRPTRRADLQNIKNHHDQLGYCSQINYVLKLSFWFFDWRRNDKSS